MIDLLRIQKVHIVGIGGIGVSAIGKLLIAEEKKVTGSDLLESAITRELSLRGADVRIGSRPEMITEDVGLIVRSVAVPDENPEISEANRRGIPVMSYPEMLALIMRKRPTKAVVSGTNGKTTTAALLGSILATAGFDPEVIIGGKREGWDGNLRIGGGSIFVAEGCEYRRSFLALEPDVILLTNIEEDHLDYYRDIGDIRDAFKTYIEKLKRSGGMLVYNADDPLSLELAHEVSPPRIVSYGIENAADLTARSRSTGAGEQTFELVWQGKSLGLFSTKLPGIYNIYNILCAAAGALSLEGTEKDIAETLASFPGVWRRFERLGTFEGAEIISDYAHHPTAIRGAIDAAKEFSPDKKILFLWEPHQTDRTVKLKDDFITSFADADHIGISEIYEVAGREERGKFSARAIADALRSGGKDVFFAENLAALEKFARKAVSEYDVILFMGAGAIDSLARRIAERKDE
ncbi:UDP-N-acetylmuramate--L-alanine ligase [bacterium]|nr:UDP-N-acetylmuramate--L-alanine ligase [bacterium]